MPDRKEEAAKLYEDGFSLKQVGQAIDVSAEMVSRYLQDMGIPRRPKGFSVHKFKADVLCARHAAENGWDKTAILYSLSTNTVGRLVEMFPNEKALKKAEEQLARFTSITIFHHPV